MFFRSTSKKGEKPMATQGAATPAGSELQEIIGLLFTVGLSAASIFIKNPAHQQKAATIGTLLQQLLPTIETLF